ncbi:unnamed protein product [Arabis nemorensis]|uniref:Aldose 1-epimerase n=1 Tax=Arabis nemorensis TaxID=586526 RepID=A0A565CLG1_9BRAS|nr:unnamed protein product [Arabis nemorensis]
MARVSILLCLVLLITLGVVISVSFADNIEVKSTEHNIEVKSSEHSESSKKEKNVDHYSKHKEKGGEKVNNDQNLNKKDEKKEHDDLHKKRKSGDIVLGYDSIKSYKTDKVYFGATVGRVANRIGKAQFKLNGKEYKTSANDGKNTLHGGKKGFGDVVWAVTKHQYDGKKPHIVFTYTSPDGDQGFPGELNVTVTYKLVKNNELSVVMEAKPKDKATPVNLAHHSYWNLGGHNAGDIFSEEIQILGSSYTPVDGELIPTGQISPVKGTPYDFLQLRPIKDNMKDLKTGYDINYCLDGKAEKMRKIVELVDKKSGRKMELSGNQPGLQFYTGGMLKDIKGKNGTVYKAFAGLCLETQSYPDALNHPKFPSQIVEPGKKYKHTMLFKFSIVS